MSPKANEPLAPDSLKHHWELIEESRTAMAKEIKAIARSLTGPRSRQLNSVSRWLKGSQGYEALLERPDVLCFCQPCVDAILKKPNQEPLSELEMAAAIGVGFCKFENSAPMPCDMTPFWYPAFAFLAWLIMITFASIFLLPNFREMFEEFGIQLPLATQFILEMGKWFEANWLTLFALIVQLPLALLFFLWLSQRGSAYSLNWLDRRLTRFRTKISFWATHVATLLSVGVSETDAVQIAGRCSASSILQARCDAFAQDRMQDLLDPSRYPLVNNSLLLKDKAAKIRILEETARYYQAVSRIVQSWWLAWLSKAILVLIALTIFILVFSLFAPMLSITSGLGF